MNEKLEVGEHITLKQQDSGIWYITHPNRDGESVTYSTGVRGSAKEMKKWVKESKIQDLVEVGMRTRLTSTVVNHLTNRIQNWEELVKEWESHMEHLGRSPRTIVRNVDHMKRFLREMQIDNRRKAHTITEKDVYEWINIITDCKLTTKKTMLQSLRSAWEFFLGRGYVDTNIVKNTGIRYDKMSHEQLESKGVKGFTKEQFNRLISGIEQEIEDIYKDRVAPKEGGKYTNPNKSAARLSYLKFFLSACHLAYGIGLRRSDCCLLVWDSIITEQGWIIVHTEKTNARVAVPYEKETIAEFLADVPKADREVVRRGLEDSAAYIKKGIELIDQENGVDLVWCYPKWRREFNKFNGAKISMNFKRTLDRIGIKGYSFHSLRHGRIREWKRLGISLEQIGRFVGHSNTKTTEGYLG